MNSFKHRVKKSRYNQNIYITMEGAQNENCHYIISIFRITQISIIIKLHLDISKNVIHFISL